LILINNEIYLNAKRLIGPFLSMKLVSSKSKEHEIFLNVYVYL